MANNVAYTPARLSLHTDYPALNSAPGVSELCFVYSVYRIKLHQTNMFSFMSLFAAFTSLFQLAGIWVLCHHCCKTSICAACVLLALLGADFALHQPG